MVWLQTMLASLVPQLLRLAAVKLTKNKLWSTPCSQVPSNQLDFHRWQWAHNLADSRPTGTIKCSRSFWIVLLVGVHVWLMASKISRRQCQQGKTPTDWDAQFPWGYFFHKEYINLQLSNLILHQGHKSCQKSHGPRLIPASLARPFTWKTSHEFYNQHSKDRFFFGWQVSSKPSNHTPGPGCLSTSAPANLCLPCNGMILTTRKHPATSPDLPECKLLCRNQQNGPYPEKAPETIVSPEGISHLLRKQERYHE